MRKISLCMIALLVLGLISGCSAPTPAATPTPTRTPQPALPTATPTVALPPTITPTPMPPSVEATAPPPDVNPLTGERPADPSLLDQIPLAIKISNSAEVRPQSGLSSADLIFEHFAEGGITRFTAVFYGETTERVGSVRSGRLLDKEIPAMYGAMFAYSGSSAGVKEKFRASDLFPNYIAAPDFGMGEPYFYRVPKEGLAFEHTLFTDPQVLHQLATERGINQRPTYSRFMAFDANPPAGGTSASYLEVNYLPNYCTAEWDYDPAVGKWRRSTTGTVLNDALTGKPVYVSNVILVFANHVETDILEDTWGGGHQSIEIQVWGGGPVMIFRDGQVFKGFWLREKRNEMLTFWDSMGKPLALKPGHSWFQMVPLDTTTEEFTPGKLRFNP